MIFRKCNVVWNYRMKKEGLRPLYEELKGYLSQAPKSTDPFDSMYDASIWNQYNETVKLISKITGEDYERFCIVPITDEPLTCVRIDTYRQKLNGLISRLKAEYSLDKPQPVKVPNTVITLTQQQNQSIHIQIVLEIQSKIDEHISHYQEGSKERNFLNKLKESLSSVSNISQLISHILKIAKDMGLDIADIARFFN
jgi:hypothetical protein